MSALVAKLAALLGKSVAWVLAHKSEIATFLAAGALAVTPEKYRGTAQALALAAGISLANKGSVQAAKTEVAKHVEEDH